MPAAYHIDQTHNFATTTVTEPVLDTKVAQDLAAGLLSRLRCDGATQFVVDLSRVQALDSGALGALIGLCQEIEHVRGRIVLVGCRGSVGEVFKLTRVDGYLCLCDDVEEARSVLSGT
jgi:anti-anti-sigma factor